MATLARIDIYPFKSLDGQRLDEVTLLPGGALENDRRFALVDAQGEVVNGKRTHLIQRLRSHFDASANTLALRVEGTAEMHTFDVAPAPSKLTDWLSDYFDLRVTIIENAAGGFPDDTESPGPTLISRATLAEVGGWFGLTVDQARERFRANLEIDGVEPFWEDRLVAAGLATVRFQLGEAELLGTNPCARCIVPTRDARSGEMIHGFAKAFAQKRAAALPAWAAADRFDHYYRLSLNTRRAGARPCMLREGDELRVPGID